MTSYNQNNGQRGCMFNITAVNPVTILCFDANLYAGTTADYEIYYKSGSFVGSETNAGAWTLAGTTTALTSAGTNLPTAIPIPVNVFIPAGQTYAFYVTNTFGGGTSYTSGTGATTLLGSDASINVNGGVGKSYPFGLTFNYRNFNGHVHYTPGSPLDVDLYNFEVSAHGSDVYLDWKSTTETNNDYYTIERSLDTEIWEVIATIDGAGTTTEEKEYEHVDRDVKATMAYYRLSQTDFDGTREEFGVRAVKLVHSEPNNEIIMAPNPSNNFVHIIASKDEIGTVKVFTLSGQEVSNIPINYTLEGASVDIRTIKSGMYIVRMNESSALLKKID